jgi:tRNA threonylcarbamoyladenosine biosynthesis protein TsaE
MKEFICTETNLSQVVVFVKNLILNKEISMLLLTGELGSGKTTFTRNLVQSFDSEQRPNSPTYTLMNEYRLQDYNIYHFDLYRLKSESEIEELGFEEIWKSEICIIEWWQVANSFLDSKRMEIKFFHHTETERKIQCIDLLL